MKKIFTLAVIGMASVSMSYAQTTLTLDDCRRLAVENNAKVRMADGNRLAAKEVSEEAFTKYFPNVSASWLGFAANKSVLRYNLPSVGQMLPPGIDALIPPEFSGVLDSSLGQINMIKNGWMGSIYAIQPVFMGGMISNGNKLAHVGEEVADLQKQSAIDEVLVTAEQYYWQIVALQAEKSTLQSVIAMVDTLENQVAVAVKAGVVMPNDLLKVKLQANELDATMVDLDNGITLASNLLAQYVGLNGDSIVIAGENIPKDVPQYPLDIYVDPATAVTATTDYQLLQQNVKAQDLRTRMVEGERLPKVGLGAGWMYDDLISQKHNYGAVMVAVSVPISDWWGGSHKVKKSRIDAENARIEQEDLSQMLELKIQNAWDALTAAHRKLTIAHEAIGQATENLRLNENYYRAGVSTITDLLDAQTLYRQSVDRFTEAYCAYRLTHTQYLNATGRLNL